MNWNHSPSNSSSPLAARNWKFDQAEDQSMPLEYEKPPGFAAFGSTHRRMAASHTAYPS
jgi:hypothetical protein